MKRNILLKSNASQTLTFIHDWFIRKIAEDLKGGFETNDLADVFMYESKEFSIHEWLNELPRENLGLSDQEYNALLGMSDQEFINGLNTYIRDQATIKGIFSGLSINERKLILVIQVQYSVEIATQNIPIPNKNFPAISITCYDLGEYRTEVMAYNFTNLNWLLDALWVELRSKFRVEEQQASGRDETISGKHPLITASGAQTGKKINRAIKRGNPKDNFKQGTDSLLPLMPKNQETLNRFEKAWRIWKKMLKEYKYDVLDQASKKSQPTIQDLRARVLSEVGWRVSERRLQTVIRLGDANLFKIGKKNSQ